ncbi:MAG: 30S ribosomal protein S15 [Vampirovibrio sp.]|jgi:small subunit ribosomal protein S15
MSITLERKSELRQAFGKDDKDTGATQVQIAVLSERIRNLTAHLKENHKDYATRRGLLMLVGKRRRLLKYFASKHTPEQYKTLIDSLNIRK